MSGTLQVSFHENQEILKAVVRHCSDLENQILDVQANVSGLEDRARLIFFRTEHINLSCFPEGNCPRFWTGTEVLGSQPF